MSQIRTRSQHQALSHKIFLNGLILDNIFQYLKLNGILKLSLVCKEWNAAIKRQISKYKTAFFSNKPNQRMIGNVRESVHRFDLLKISKLRLDASIFSYRSNNDEVQKLDTIVLNILEKCGSQIKELRFEHRMKTKKDLEMMKTILSLTPNVGTLYIDYLDDIENFYSVFKDFFHPKLRRLHIWNSLVTLTPLFAKEFVRTTSKCFPNLRTNFGETALDFYLIEMLLDQKVTMRMGEFRNDIANPRCLIENINFLSQLSPQVHALTMFELWHISKLHERKTQTVYNVLRNFASTLKIVNIQFSHDWNCKELLEFALPPLPVLRKLSLQTSSFFGRFDDESIRCSLGKRIGKDYPLLEYFTFKPVDRYTGIEDDASKRFWTSCKLWHPIVPVCNEESAITDFDLSPLKFLKFVDLNIPLQWTHYEENREWCKKFLDVYLQVYGNGGRGTIQHIVDWLK